MRDLIDGYWVVMVWVPVLLLWNKIYKYIDGMLLKKMNSKNSSSEKAKKFKNRDIPLKKIKYILLVGFVILSIGGYKLYDYFAVIPEIKYEGASVEYNGGIGSDWSFNVTINGQSVSYGDIIEPKDGKYYIQVVAIEEDEYSDIGKASKTIKATSLGEFSIPVIVRETKGRGAGKSAKVVFDFVVTD